MIVPLLHQWTKANALFKPPVINQCRTIELKLTKLWHKAVETSLGKGNLARKNEFLHTLDTLFDILTCKCSIQLCSESNCSHSGKRENNSHIDCGCPREKKIPVLELEFIKAQRTKAEGQGSMQMGSIDYSETKKQIANAKKREQIREREQKKKMKSEEAIQREEELCQDVYHFFDIPPINVNATKLSELVDLSLEVLEPPLTTSLTSQELRNLKETPMQVPKWPSHTQSVERCVKMVTEAAGHVYSHERREAKRSLRGLSLGPVYGDQSTGTVYGDQSTGPVYGDQSTGPVYRLQLIKCTPSNRDNSPKRSSMESTRSKTEVWLIGQHITEITGAQLPSRGDVLRLFFHGHNEHKKTVNDSASEVAASVISFWNKARIPTITEKSIGRKVVDLFLMWKGLKKNCTRTTDTQRKKEETFCDELEDLFDVAHPKAMQLLTIKEDRAFLAAQREKGRRGVMAGVDKKIACSIKRREESKRKLEQRREGGRGEKAEQGGKE
ncbi:hypothetical protein Hamer_G025856, partial [Homarus americanus]